MDSSVFMGGSVIAAVLAGAIALFAPCCISVMLPAYFAKLVPEPAGADRDDVGVRGGHRHRHPAERARRGGAAPAAADRAHRRLPHRWLAARGGVLFPPGVLLDGEPFSYGRLSERRLRRELDRKLKVDR